ncbi:acetylglucosaminylphosphatidylinositol deacetylase [Mycobacterium antarcticum]|uniref:PIG-L deacetylase family protein n=1 Tax=Mycolicibacterium sp. TUM20983 TaxID=3023369 RepID=UPI0023848576|nr:PIG-L family deacetylase [Mycolicibacterium sp. TUM20983]GLP73968.1 acetylglucosaminylphosphatidylinositol deacetylase [Mycolicibacterium sp. TUM20983]
MSPATTGNGARFAAEPISGGGTPAAAWREWVYAIPALDLSECPGLLVVAPHPDDETLGFGAAASQLRSRGVEVTVVSVTDGGGSVPGLSPVERRWLERDRRAELFGAVEVLGLDEPVCLGLPDGELAEREEQLTASLVELITAGQAGLWCAATWRGDGHPDHEAVGRGAAAAVAGTDAVLLEYPVWMWHWARPGDDAVPWDRMAMVPLDQESTARKRQAVAAFHTQLVGHETGPDVDVVLPPFVLQRLFAIGEAVIR